MFYVSYLQTWTQRFTGFARKFHTLIQFKYGAEIPCTILLVATNVPLQTGKMNNLFET
jgi:hypothetical protein